MITPVVDSRMEAVAQGPSGSPSAVEQVRLRLVARPDEIAHLVCCRDAVWRTAFCGVQSEEINPAAEMICSMCLEEVEALLPGWALGETVICPVDGNACPPEAEVDERIMREVHGDT
jgi:hypothetical protein